MKIEQYRFKKNNTLEILTVNSSNFDVFLDLSKQFILRHIGSLPREDRDNLRNALEVLDIRMVCKDVPFMQETLDDHLHLILQWFCNRAGWDMKYSSFLVDHLKTRYI